MNPKLPDVYHLSSEVAFALTRGTPLVALESAVITHGLPRPHNLELAREMENLIRAGGATPATIALLRGKMAVGLSDEDLLSLAQNDEVTKVSLRNMGIGLARGLSGGTTVAATLFTAHHSGIKVFATGGIGGIHRGNAFDVSADLNALAEHPVVVVCAGAKAILDLPATLEALETRGVPVIGFGTDDFPAFYSRSSGLPVDCRVDDPAEVAAIARAHWKAGHHGAILVGNPVPERDALDPELIGSAIKAAIVEAELKCISGAALTPFLLEQVNRVSAGKSMQANLALLRNNAKLAARIAAHLSSSNLVTL
jgi:pseudouridine-5'-phosphate glycosidase